MMRLLFYFILSASLVHASEESRQLFYDHLLGEGDDHDLHLHSDYESRYASEGRDSLDGGGLATASIEAVWKAVSLGAWYGNSPDQNYDELQLSGALSWAWKDLQGYVAYTHLRFPQNKNHDHEIGTGISWSGLPGEMEFSLDGYYSFGADGTFIDTSLRREFDVTERLQIVPALVFGVNQGYVTDGHDGANHVALQLGAAYSLTEKISVDVHAGYNFAMDRDEVKYAGDALLVDFFHAGISLVYDF